MKINFAKKFKPYKIIQSSIGELAVFPISLSDKTKIEERFNNNLNEISTKEYMSEFVKYACHKKNILNKSQEKPQDITLTDEEINILNEADLEVISKIYIENNEYLNKKSIQETKKDEKGIDTNTIKYGDIISPKMDNENFQQYLLRLEIEYNKRISDSFKKSFGNLSSFSKGIQESLRNTINIGEQLNNSLNTMQTFRTSKIEPIVPYPKINFEKLKSQISEDKNRPFQELAESLDRLVDINSESTKFMIEANKLQTRIAEEIKGSSNSSTKLSRINILIAIVVLVVTVLSFAYSIYTVSVSNKINNQNIERAIKGLNTINESIKTNKEYFDQTSKRLNTLEHQLDSVSNKND